MTNGKGSKPRPLAVAREAYLNNWEDTFGSMKVMPRHPTAFHCALCGAIMSRVTRRDATKVSTTYECPNCERED